MYYSLDNDYVFKSHSEIRLFFRDVSLPKTLTNSILEQLGVFPVVITEPVYNQTIQVAKEAGCEYNSDLQQWQTAWLIRDKTEDEITSDAAYMQKQIITAVQYRLDTFAQSRNYDGILSACTYATSGNPRFTAEGQAAVDARDITWETLYNILDEVKSGVRAMPSAFADIEGDLPTLTWPE